MKARPKSTMNQRGRTKNARNHNLTQSRMEMSEIESFNDPPKFGDNVKGMKFGAPKMSTATLSTKRHSKATTATRTQKQ